MQDFTDRPLAYLQYGKGTRLLRWNQRYNIRQRFEIIPP